MLFLDDDAEMRTENLKEMIRVLEHQPDVKPQSRVEKNVIYKLGFNQIAARLLEYY